MIFLITYWRQLTIIVAPIILFSVGYLAGDTAANKRNAYAQAQSTINAKNKIIEGMKDDQRINENVFDEHQIEIDAIERHYAAIIDGLHTNTDTDLPGVSGGAGRASFAACPNQLPKRREEATALLMKRADENTARLMQCQAWIKAHKDKK